MANPDKVIINDAQVTVEIIDSVLGKMTVSDMAVEDPNRMDYVRNKQLYQKKLTAGANITIDEDNVISSELDVQGIPQLISSDAGNAITQGEDGRLLVAQSRWLRNGGTVETREELPILTDSFVAYMVKSENLVVFSYISTVGGSNSLVWLPLSFFADMDLYATKALLGSEIEKCVKLEQLAIAGVANTVVLRDSTGSFDVQSGTGDLSAANFGQIKAHNLSEDAHPFILSSIDSIKQEMADKEHFRGYYPTTADVLAIPNPESGDYAYNAETGTKWLYTTEWADTDIPVPDKTVPASNSLPLMNGVANAGVTEEYSRGDHVHPTDTSRVPTSRKINGYDLSVDRSLTFTDVGASPKVHSSSDVSQYGGGTAVVFGHVKLSSSTSSADDETTSTAATPYAVKAVNDALVSEVSSRESADIAVESNAKTYTDTEVGKVQAALNTATAVQELSEGWATVDGELVSVISAYAIGNSQLRVIFTPVEDILPENTPVTICSNASESLIPSLKIRFGGIWDYGKVEQVGFCVFDQDGDLSINAVSKLTTGTEYTLLV